MATRTGSIVVSAIFAPMLLLAPALAAQDALYGEANLIHVIEVFDKVNKGQTFKQSCDCVKISSVTEESSSKFPSPRYKVFKVTTEWFGESGNKAFDSFHYLAHEVGTDNSTWYVHHLKFAMKPVSVP